MNGSLPNAQRVQRLTNLILSSLLDQIQFFEALVTASADSGAIIIHHQATEGLYETLFTYHLFSLTVPQGLKKGGNKSEVNVETPSCVVVEHQPVLHGPSHDGPSNRRGIARERQVEGSRKE